MSTNNTRHHTVMGSKASPIVSDWMKSTRAQGCSKLEDPQQSLHRKHFSLEEKCYLAHHVNQCHDFQDVCQLLNLHFNTDRTLESITLFFSRCDDSQFFELTEQAQAFKWCTPHPTKPIIPPSTVLGTSEWRTELRAFLAFQASNKLTTTALTERLSATFPEESRTFAEVRTHLSVINESPILVRQLKWFAASYPWHPSYIAAVGTSQATKAASKAHAKGAARARLDAAKKRSARYIKSSTATAVQVKLLK